jgi:sulfonate transport system substrate-binding protein
MLVTVINAEPRALAHGWEPGRVDMYKALTSLLMAVFLLAGMNGCSREGEQGIVKQREKLTLAVTPWPASAPIYVAYENGYFEDEAIDLTLQSYSSGHLGLAAMLSGKTDLATAGETPIAIAAVDGKPIVVIATSCEIDRAIRIIGRKDKGISAPQDLKGKRIGVVSGTTADFFLHIYLTTSYIDLQEVQVVNLEADKLVDALLEGHVDAVSTWWPYTLVLLDNLGANGLALQDPDIYTMTWDMVATEDFVRRDPECIRRFLRAMIRADRFIAEQPAQARVICLRYIGTYSPLFEKEWTEYRFTLELDQSLILNMEDQARWMFDIQGAEDQRPPNFMDFIYAEGLKSVRPESVRIPGK